MIFVLAFFIVFSFFYFIFLFFFFFQAEDGIRDRDVTGVQTCALRSNWMVMCRPKFVRACN